MFKGAKLIVLVLGCTLAGCNQDRSEEPTAARTAKPATSIPRPVANEKSATGVEPAQQQLAAAEPAAAEPAAAEEQAATPGGETPPTATETGKPNGESAGSPAKKAAAPTSPAKKTEPQSGKEPPALKAPANTGAVSIQRCCSALARAAKSDTKNKNRYDAARTVCVGLAQQVKVGKAEINATMTTLRAQLQGVPLPNGC